MNRNTALPIKKLSLLLVSAGIGVFSTSASTCAQTLPALLESGRPVPYINTVAQAENPSRTATLGNALPPIVSVARKPIELMTETNWLPTRDSRQSADQDVSIRTLPPIVSVARTPMELMKETNWLPTRSADQSGEQSSSVVAKEKQLNSVAFAEQLIVKSFSAEMIAASKGTPTVTPETQVSSYLEPADFDPADLDLTDLDLASTDTKDVNPPAFDLETAQPAAPVAVFIDGPDTLSVGQVGDYEIAVANGTSLATAISSIRLQIPASAEILVVERKAQINDLDRTLTWSVSELASGKQERIRFRLKFVRACDANFSITIDQRGLESQTFSQETVVK